MPKLAVPDGCRADWRGRRKNSSVHLWVELPLIRESTQPPIPFTIALPRAVFFDPVATARAFEALADAVVRVLPDLRMTTKDVKLSLKLEAGRASIAFPRSTLSILRRWVRLAGDQAAEYLGAALASHACGNSVGVLIATSPRGKNAWARPVTLALPAAFVAAHSMVRDQALRPRIETLLSTDAESREYLACEPAHQSALVVALVRRAFRGVADLLALDGPTTLMRRYRYGEHGKQIAARAAAHRDRNPRFGKMLDADWTDLYLGPPGAAAKAFRLPFSPTGD